MPRSQLAAYAAIRLHEHCLANQLLGLRRTSLLALARRYLSKLGN